MINWKSARLIREWDDKSSQKSRILLLVSCIGSALVVGSSIHLDLAIKLLMTVFVIVTFFFLVARFSHLSNNRDWVFLSAELVVPAVIWILFGLGGLLSFLFPEVISMFGATYEAATVFLTALYASVGAVCYVWAFRWSSWFISSQPQSLSSSAQRALIPLLGILLLFDWYVRVDQIQNGIYFVWLVQFSEVAKAETRTVNALYHLHTTVEYLTLPLLMHILSTRSKVMFFRLLFFFQLLLIAARGQRRNILFSVLLIGISHLAFHKLQVNYRLVLIVLLFLALFLFVLGPVMQEARFMMRFDARSLVRNPLQLLWRYFTHYIPRAFTLDRILGRETVSLRIQQHAGLVERMGGYMSYAASIHQAILDDQVDPNFGQLTTALSLVIPRALYRGKIAVDADAMAFDYFGFGQVGLDATGSPLADVFGYLHLPGIILLFIVVGLGYGFVARYLRTRFGRIGDMLIVGILPLLAPTGDAFGGYLARLRNVILSTLLITMFVRAYAILSVSYSGLRGKYFENQLFDPDSSSQSDNL